jgi:hypothetical protein
MKTKPNTKTKPTAEKKSASQPSFKSSAPGEDEIREYAYHLYLQSGCIPGRDEDNWREAEACLSMDIPLHRAHVRMHHHLNRAARHCDIGDAAAIACEALDAKHLAA